MNLKTAARRLGVHYQTAYKWVRSGDLVAVKIGLRYEISEAALARFEASRAALLGPPHPAETELGSPERVGPAIVGEPTTALARLSDLTNRVVLDAGPLLRLTALHGAELIGDLCVIRLISEDREWLEVVAYDHPDPARLALCGTLLAASPMRVDAGPIARPIGRGKSLLSPHVPQDQRLQGMPREFHQHRDELSVHSLAAAPVIVEGRPSGYVAVTRDRPGHPYMPEDLHLVEQLAAIASRALERAGAFAAAWRERSDLTERIEVLLAAEFAAGRARELHPLDEWLEDCLAADEVPEAVLDVEGHFLAVNERFCLLVGHDRDELASVTCADITHPDDHQREQALIDKLVSGELDHYDEKVRRITRDGTIVPCVVHRSAARTPDATLRCIVTVLRPLDD